MLQPLREKGRFSNPLPIERLPRPWGGKIEDEPSYLDLYRWLTSRPRHPRTWDVPRADPAPARLGPAPAIGIAATWIGHSSVLLQIDGANLLCDPVWSRRLAGGFVSPRYTPPGVAWSALPRIDGLLVSHDHYDHLDAPTIQRLPRETPVVVGLGLGRWFRARGFREIDELGWGDAAKLAGHRVTFVPAQHFSGRTPFDRDATLWGGFVVEGREGSVAYFAGDSGYFAGFREIGERFPRIDLCLMPAGAYEPRWFMSPVHVDPEEALQAFLDVRARVMLPIHWGTFRLTDEPIDEAPRRLARAWDERGLDRARLRVPALGATVRVGAD